MGEAKKNKEALDALCMKIQIELQEAIMKVLADNGPAAKEARLAFGDVSFALGSAYVSSLIEAVREPDQAALLTPELQTMMGHQLRHFTDGFNDKVAFMSNPMNLASAVIDPSAPKH